MRAVSLRFKSLALYNWLFVNFSPPKILENTKAPRHIGFARGRKESTIICKSDPSVDDGLLATVHSWHAPSENESEDTIRVAQRT